MKKIWNIIWKTKMTKIWLFVGNIIMLFIAIASIVVTQVPLINNTVNTIMGGDRRILVSGDPEASIHYESNYPSKEAALKAANKLNEEIASEGFVLLKNDDNALPLSNGDKLSVFGKNSVNLVYGGSGSGASSSSDIIGIHDALAEDGFVINNTLKDFYNGNSSGGGRGSAPAMGSILTGYAIGESPISNYTTDVKNSYTNYNDAALVVISRIGGEGYDLPRTMVDSRGALISGARNATDHYLQLDQNETDLLKHASENFNKVILIINSATPMELGFLSDATHYAYTPNLKACIWIGSPGNSGIKALGDLLKGEITPSGKTVDLYAKDFSKDPTWENFSNNFESNGNRYINAADNKNANAYFIDYEEGIYVGYRYYETRGFTDGDTWYNNNVVFPFGYGLSYTSFDWEVLATSTKKTITENDDIVVVVKVTNTGNAAGKDVVQLYYTAPYTDGEIEKAHVVLGAFGKTKVLQKGESDILTLTLKASDMASYDYSDANNNGFKGYELEAGNYQIKISRTSHDADVVHTENYVVASTIQMDKDPVTGNTVENRFDEVSDHIDTYLSRNDWDGTFPTRPTLDDRKVSQELLDSMNYKLNDKTTDPWYTTEMKTLASEENTSPIQLYEMIGASYDDERWEQILDYVTLDQMIELIGVGNFHSMQLTNIGKPRATDPDGPAGFTNFMGDPTVYDTCFYACEMVIGSTWNKELAYAMGAMVGNEGIWGNVKGDGAPYSGWYAPAVNIHRSPFSGRNWEYYSEDPYLSGIMGANVVQGAKSKGVYTYIKHFVLNDQETDRSSNGLITWANEQSMREIYFRAFEIIVKVGETNGMMSSFNRIGTEWVGGSYRVLTEVLRDEWGFKGTVITDYSILLTYMNADQMIRAGGDLNLTQDGGEPSTIVTPTQVSLLRQATKNILYTVANSNAMNGYGPGVVYRYAMPIWKIILIIVNVGVVLGNATWGFLVIRKAVIKRNKETLVLQE